MPERMEDPRELFLHELGDLLYVEKSLYKELPKLAQEATDEDLSGAFEAHREETKQHADNLEQIFEMLGEAPKAEQCPGIDGIKEEHDEFIKEETVPCRPSATCSSRARGLARSTTKSPPTGLITMAQAMGESDVVALLQENVRRSGPPSRSSRRRRSGSPAHTWPPDGLSPSALSRSATRVSGWTGPVV